MFLPLAAYPLYLQFFGPHAHHGSPFTKDYFGADVTAFFTPTPGVLLHRAADLETPATSRAGSRSTWPTWAGR